MEEAKGWMNKIQQAIDALLLQQPKRPMSDSVVTEKSVGEADLKYELVYAMLNAIRYTVRNPRCGACTTTVLSHRRRGRYLL